MQLERHLKNSTKTNKNKNHKNNNHNNNHKNDNHDNNNNHNNSPCSAILCPMPLTQPQPQPFCSVPSP